MDSSARVLPFRPVDDRLSRRDIVVIEPGPGSRPVYLRSLHGAAIGNTELETDPYAQLGLAFDHAGAVRRAAINARVAQPILGFALAVPVGGRQTLADVILVNRFDPHVADTLFRKHCWGLLLAVAEPTRKIGIGRALANQALDGIRAAGGERVYVAVRALDQWLVTRFLDLGFNRDGTTVERHPRVLFSRDVNFTF